MNKIKICFRCPVCSTVHYLEITEAELDRFEKLKENKTINTIFPNMPKEDREKFISGLCYKCQKDIFGGEVITE